MLFALTSVILLVTFVSARPEPPIDSYLPPDQQYGPPNRNPTDFNVGNIQNRQNNINSFDNNQYLPPNQQYGPPGGTQNSGYDDNSNNAPAKYDFEYSVNDPESGNDFGHKESRDGDVTRGTYYVLLPDGRRQTVVYIADQNGYQPVVTYTQEGSGIGGGGSGGANGYPGGNNGYQY